MGPSFAAYVARAGQSGVGGGLERGASRWGCGWGLRHPRTVSLGGGEARSERNEKRGEGREVGGVGGSNRGRVSEYTGPRVSFTVSLDSMWRGKMV